MGKYLKVRQKKEAAEKRQQKQQEKRERKGIFSNEEKAERMKMPAVDLSTLNTEQKIEAFNKVIDKVYEILPDAFTHTEESNRRSFESNPSNTNPKIYENFVECDRLSYIAFNEVSKVFNPNKDNKQTLSITLNHEAGYCGSQTLVTIELLKTNFKGINKIEWVMLKNYEHQLAVVTCGQEKYFVDSWGGRANVITGNKLESHLRSLPLEQKKRPANSWTESFQRFAIEPPRAPYYVIQTWENKNNQMVQKTDPLIVKKMQFYEEGKGNINDIEPPNPEDKSCCDNGVTRLISKFFYPANSNQKNQEDKSTTLPSGKEEENKIKLD